MADLGRNSLRELLRRRIRALSRTAQRRGHLSRRDVEDLEQLAKLVRIRRAFLPSWRLRSFVAAFVSFLVALAVFRVSRTEVEMDLEVSEVNFTLAQDERLAALPRLRSIGVSRLAEVRIPRRQDPSSATLRAETLSVPPGGFLAAKLEVGGGREGSLTLADPELPLGGRCSLASQGGPGRFRLSLGGEGLALRVTVNGRVRLAVVGPDRRTEDMVLTSPRDVVFVSAAPGIDLDLALDATSEWAHTSRLPVTKVSFVRVEERTTPAATLVRLQSTIRSGTLYFESLAGQTHPLRAGEMIRFEVVSGWIRGLRIEGDHLSLDFRGEVRDLTLGVEDGQRNIMPSYLIWLRANQALALLLGVAAAVVNVFLLWRSSS